MNLQAVCRGTEGWLPHKLVPVLQLMQISALPLNKTTESLSLLQGNQRETQSTAATER